MIRGSSWFAVVLVLVILFVTSDCLRSSTHDEGRDLSTIRSRGNARFTKKAEEGVDTTPEPLTTTSRSNRRNNLSLPAATTSRRRTNTKTEATTEKAKIEFSPSSPFRSRSRSTVFSNGDLSRAASGDRRYLPESLNRKKVDKIEEDGNLQAPHESSRGGNQRGPAKSRSSRAEFQRRFDVFDSTDEITAVPKSRNERKIQTTLSSRDFEDSNRYSSRRAFEGSSGSRGSSRDVYGTQRSPVRHITERSIRRHDVDSSNSDQVNVGAVLNSQALSGNVDSSSAAPCASDSFDSKKGPSKLIENSSFANDGGSKAPEESSRFKKFKPAENSRPRNRGRSLNPFEDRSGFNSETRSSLVSQKTKPERSERIEKPGAKVDRRNFSLSDRPRPKLKTFQPSMKSTKPILSTVDATLSTGFDEETTTTSSPQKSDYSGYRRAAASTLAIKTLPKDENLTANSAVRGRKGYTTISNQDEEIVATDIPTTTMTSNRQRGGKVFNKASIAKADKEIDESDNYPPEFKAKLAQLKNNNNGRDSSRSKEVITRHSRSIDQAGLPETETDEISGLYPVLSTSEGSKKQMTPDFSSRSRQKLEEARKQVKPELKSAEVLNIDSSSTIASVPGSIPASTAAIPLSTTSSPSTTSIKFKEESKSLRAPKRYGSIKLSTPRAITETAKTNKKLARTAKSVERSNVRVGKISRRQRKERITSTPDDELIRTTVPYSESTEVKTSFPSREVETTTAKPDSTTRRSRVWNAAYIDKNWQEPTQKSTEHQSSAKSYQTTKRPRGFNPSYERNRASSTSATSATSRHEGSTVKSTSKTTKRTRAWNTAYIDKNWEDPAKKADKLNSSQSNATSFRSRNSIQRNSSSSTTEKTRRRDSRPRTATYRRHLEVPQKGTSQTAKKEVSSLSSVAITPRYHASIKATNSTQQSIKRESAVSLELSNEVNGNETTSTTNSSGISSSSRGNSGNSDSVIFNPAKATYLINSNASLLEQIRSTVAPLLSALGAKSPAFAGVYRNVSSNETSVPRVTPSGAPPRFSARYRGVELFVRKPNDANSTANALSPLTPQDETSSPVSVSNPGEPAEVTYYRALETVRINNEVDQATDDEKSQLDRVAQVVDSAADNGFNSSNTSNDTTSTIRPVEDSLNITESQTLTITQPDVTQIPEVAQTMNQPFDPLFVNANNVTAFSSTGTESTSNLPPESTQIPEISSNSLSSSIATSNPATSNSSAITESSSHITLMPSSTEIINSPSNSFMKIAGEVNTTESAIASATSEASFMIFTTENANTERHQAKAMEIIMESLNKPDVESTTVRMITSSEAEAETTSAIVDSTTVNVVSSVEMESSSEATTEITDITSEAVPNQVTEADAGSTVITESNVNNQTDITENTTQSDESSVTVANESSADDIDDSIISQMMTRLMDIVSKNGNHSHKSNSADKDDLNRMLGGFLDHTDRNGTLELDGNNETESTTVNLIKSSIETTPMSANNSTDLVLATESPNMRISLESDNLMSNITEMNDDESTTLNSLISATDTYTENMTLISLMSQTDISIDDTNTTNDYEITTLASETLGTTEIDSSVTHKDSEIITNVPTLAPEILATDDPNSLAGFQESTTATAQTTAGSPQPTTQSSTTTSEIPSTESLSSTTEAPSSIAIIYAVTPESPSTTEITSTSEPSPLTSEPTSSTLEPSSTTEILSSTSESLSSTSEFTTAPPSSTQPPSTSTSPSSTSAETTSSAPESTTMASSTLEATSEATTQTTTTTTSTSSTPPTTQYLGRFGGSRMTPAPRLSSSSSTRMPLRDYHVYGIYPNKTIVRKRPEDNLIDARNVDSPYVIFGIYPDGKLVRKFPNGTVIPDPPINPVEVVFSLSTSTTTNRPRPILQYNQANQGTIMNNNNMQNTATFNNRPGFIFTKPSPADVFRSQLDLGLSDNALNPDGDGPNQFADPTLMPGIGTVGTQLPSTNMITGASRPPSMTPSSVNAQGGRIIQDIERDTASRTKEAGGQRSTVYIGQEKFINYWTNDTTRNNSRVMSVEINSVTGALNKGPRGSSSPTLSILPNNQDQGRVTAPPGFPWKDPLDQIFGITTATPIIRASVASNTLDEPSSSRSAITTRPINRVLEVFTPMLDANQLARDTSITITNEAPAVSMPVGTSTTAQATTTSATSTTSTTTSTTSSRPTTTTTTTTFAPTMMTTTPLPTPTLAPPTTSTMRTTTMSLFTTIDNPKQTSFGNTFDDLAFLNSLLESDYRPNSISSTPKTLTEVERLLANKILSLALSQAGPTRSPKAIQPSNASPNSLDTSAASFGHSSRPIIIDLLQQSTTKKPVATTTTRVPFTWKPVTDVTSTTSFKSTGTTTTTSTTTTTMTPPVSQVIFKSFPTHPPMPPTVSATVPIILLTSSSSPSITSQIAPETSSTSSTSRTSIASSAFTTSSPLSPSSTTKPIISTSRPTPRSTSKPRTTTAAPLGFGAGLLQAIFGRNIFAPTTTQRPVIRTTKKAQTPRPIQTTLKPISSTVTREIYAASEQIDHVDVNSLLSEVSTKSSPTYSPEEDAKFLAELLDSSDKAKNGGKETSVLSNDDEAFLRSILSGQAKLKLPQGTGNSASKNAAILAELLKAQGIEPSTPPNRLREQLQASVTSTTIRPRIVSTTPKRMTSRPRPTDSPTSTYPPPLFSNFNFGLPRAENTQENSDGGVRNQVITAAIGATRLFSQFLGAAISGAAQQLQSFVRNSTRYVSEAVNG